MSTPEQKNDLGKVYALLRYIPTVLFVLYALLLPLFFTAPVAKTNVFGMTVKHGNVYTILHNQDLEVKLDGSIIALIVCAALSVLAAGTLVYLTFGRMKNKIISIKGKAFGLSDVAANGVYVLYAVFIVIVAVLNAKINGATAMEGAGFSVGAAPKLVLAFAITFGILSGLSVGLRWLFVYFQPELYTQETEVRTQAHATTEAEIARKKAALQQNEAYEEPTDEQPLIASATGFMETEPFLDNRSHVAKRVYRYEKKIYKQKQKLCAKGKASKYAHFYATHNAPLKPTLQGDDRASKRSYRRSMKAYYVALHRFRHGKTKTPSKFTAWLIWHKKAIIACIAFAPITFFVPQIVTYLTWGLSSGASYIMDVCFHPLLFLFSGASFILLTVLIYKLFS